MGFGPCHPCTLPFAYGNNGVVNSNEEIADQISESQVLIVCWITPISSRLKDVSTTIPRENARSSYLPILLPCVLYLVGYSKEAVFLEL